ncbi:MAG TPA: efflux RND transporter periplasmic adaptor subunit [Verrucomicrobiae bacterium]|nr:efflux RND transporter periplasmic adaptor subunit [Verrucomicrobiae bacterium]
MMSQRDGFGATGWIVVLALAAILAGGGYWYWQRNSENDPEYKTEPTARGDLVQVVTATGQLNPRTNVIVGCQVSGIIQKIFVDYNSHVTNHEIIAQLDPTTYKTLVAQARANLANAKAQLELAKANEERSTVLYKDKIVATADQDTAEATYHQAQAQVQLMQATLDQAEANLAYTTIYSPVNGIVISRNVDVGQTVAASLSAPTLFMIANDLGQMQIDALVSEADIGGVETNQQVNFTVDAFPTRTFQGTVIQIRNAPQTNQNVITYDTVIGVNNSDLKLRPGMTANVSIITAQRHNVLSIPNGALQFASRYQAESGEARKQAGIASATLSNGAPSVDKKASGGAPGRSGGGSGKGAGGHPKMEKVVHTVFVLEKSPDGKSDKLKPVQIRTGISDGMSTQVLDGLKEGDEVVVRQINPNGVAESSRSNPFGGGGRRF